MIDIPDLKSHIDLLALAGQRTMLRRVANTGGGEWAGPCPFCGGRDRFRVQPGAQGGGRWLCRGCSDGQWQDAIAFGQRLWPGLPFGEVCRLLSEAAGLAGGVRASFSLAHSRSGASRPAASPLASVSGGGLAYQPPDEAWQEAARQVQSAGQRRLWGREGQAALAYLRGRGLQDETLRAWGLGFSPGEKSGDLWLPRGVLIPCQALGEIWYLKIALLPGEPVRCQGCGQPTPARQACPRCGTNNKYRGVKGNRTGAIFGADELPGAWGALFVEGEFDALIAWQQLNDVLPVCTLGSASNRPDLATWGPFLAPLERIYAAYDADAAGQAGLKALQALSERVLPLPLPPGAKDVNDYVLGGGELWPWLKGWVEASG